MAFPTRPCTATAETVQQAVLCATGKPSVLLILQTGTLFMLFSYLNNTHLCSPLLRQRAQRSVGSGVVGLPGVAHIRRDGGEQVDLGHWVKLQARPEVEQAADLCLHHDSIAAPPRSIFCRETHCRVEPK